MEAKHIAKKSELSDRIEHLARNPAFIMLKGALLGLRQVLVIESLLTIMKNVFYFTSKSLFVLKIFKYLP